MKKCLLPNCEKIGASRGLCRSHYTVLNYKVIHGNTNWELLEKAGLASVKSNKTFINDLLKEKNAWIEL